MRHTTSLYFIYVRAEAELSKKLLIAIIIVIIITNRREALPLSLIFSALPFPPNALSVSRLWISWLEFWFSRQIFLVWSVGERMALQQGGRQM
uniref:Inner-membrane translocator n=1 Tax=Cucumis sativus TaxID=3659 RepID=A0A0A0LNF0_CUCSA